MLPEAHKNRHVYYLPAKIVNGRRKMIQSALKYHQCPLPYVCNLGYTHPIFIIHEKGDVHSLLPYTGGQAFDALDEKTEHYPIPLRGRRGVHGWILAADLQA